MLEQSRDHIVLYPNFFHSCFGFLKTNTWFSWLKPCILTWSKILSSFNVNSWFLGNLLIGYNDEEWNNFLSRITNDKAYQSNLSKVKTTHILMIPARFIISQTNKQKTTEDGHHIIHKVDLSKLSVILSFKFDVERPKYYLSSPWSLLSM